MNRKKLVEEVAQEAALYALGKMDRDSAEKFQRRLGSGCALCAAEVRQCEAVMEDSLQSLVAAPPAALKGRVLTALVSEKEPPLEPDWQPTGVEGVSERIIHESGQGIRSKLVRLQPGSKYPEHEHHERELCYVLEGNFWQAGKLHQAGFCETAEPASVHGEIDSPEGCLLLVVLG